MKKAGELMRTGHFLDDHYRPRLHGTDHFSTTHPIVQTCREQCWRVRTPRTVWFSP